MRPRSAAHRAPRGKFFSSLSAGLALVGTAVATAATAFAATPAGAARLDRPSPALPGQPAQVRTVGLDHVGGDLRRSVRVTRRKHRDRTAQRQSWAGYALVITRQAVPAAGLA